ncbi:hypothetical protein RGU70_00010 [Herbaspirillum sp. RTI4]|uniref:hypothetical protein n=1 Tax=Herbaspirillum sp. RTI4 TaxID=3048640 RepID=UPI002AB4750B|nr:hypothetical protein [Herbaspirillum sp. RTI4]MDY7576711.1 hypothetical protein [Herbaspirillum sp. RTI4]MEA9983414.1 hypothetical protein [Herbaspirillum sp. RTI4]
MQLIVISLQNRPATRDRKTAKTQGDQPFSPQHFTHKFSRNLELCRSNAKHLAMKIGISFASYLFCIAINLHHFLSPNTDTSSHSCLPNDQTIKQVTRAIATVFRHLYTDDAPETLHIRTLSAANSSYGYDRLPKILNQDRKLLALHVPQTCRKLAYDLQQNKDQVQGQDAGYVPVGSIQYFVR